MYLRGVTEVCVQSTRYKATPSCLPLCVSLITLASTRGSTATEPTIKSEFEANMKVLHATTKPTLSMVVTLADKPEDKVERCGLECVHANVT
jgi:hypothetical protein